MMLLCFIIQALAGTPEPEQSFELDLYGNPASPVDSTGYTEGASLDVTLRGDVFFGTSGGWGATPEPGRSEWIQRRDDAGRIRILEPTEYVYIWDQLDADLVLYQGPEPSLDIQWVYSADVDAFEAFGDAAVLVVEEEKRITLPSDVAVWRTALDYRDQYDALTLKLSCNAPCPVNLQGQLESPIVFEPVVDEQDTGDERQISSPIEMSGGRILFNGGQSSSVGELGPGRWVMKVGELSTKAFQLESETRFDAVLLGRVDNGELSLSGRSGEEGNIQVGAYFHFTGDVSGEDASAVVFDDSIHVDILPDEEPVALNSISPDLLKPCEKIELDGFRVSGSLGSVGNLARCAIDHESDGVLWIFKKEEEEEPGGPRYVPTRLRAEGVFSIPVGDVRVQLVRNGLPLVSSERELDGANTPFSLVLPSAGTVQLQIVAEIDGSQVVSTMTPSLVISPQPPDFNAIDVHYGIAAQDRARSIAVMAVISPQLAPRKAANWHRGGIANWWRWGLGPAAAVSYSNGDRPLGLMLGFRASAVPGFSMVAGFNLGTGSTTAPWVPGEAFTIGIGVDPATLAKARAVISQ